MKCVKLNNQLMLLLLNWSIRFKKKKYYFIIIQQAHNVVQASTDE